jgi:alpha-galactosidase
MNTTNISASIAASPSGIEADPEALSNEVTEAADFASEILIGPFRFIAAELRDVTDAHAELVHEREWLLHPSEKMLRLQGNVFALQNVLDGTGTVWVKLAPAPFARSRQTEWDISIERAERLTLNSEDGYEWVTVAYSGGKWGRIAALHAFQRTRRGYQAGRDGLLLCNTWGDRSRDAHLNVAFLEREIEKAAQLGADVVQIDDGWQQGITSNSTKAASGGVWNGFWDSDPHFWDVHKERFPEGISALVEQARERGLKFGLWFAPDSTNHAANWERDAGAVLRLHREYGINYFKIDALKIASEEGEENLQKFFAYVREESNEAVTFDLDITAEARFGYFGLIEAGPLFIENRYTDWKNYWPHQTLRMAWQLAHWVDPVRLRVEWLNNSRNAEKYNDHPLSPVYWPTATLFAMTMWCSPLGWFEVQNLPQAYYDEVAPLIEKWKEHRDAIFGGTMLPIGAAPDGAAWTGFVSLHPQTGAGYALLFRELNPSATWEVELPFGKTVDGSCDVLGGDGSAQVKNGRLEVDVPEALGFLWVRLPSTTTG